MSAYGIYTSTDTAWTIAPNGDYLYTCEDEETGATIQKRFEPVLATADPAELSANPFLHYDSTLPFHQSVARYFVDNHFVRLKESPGSIHKFSLSSKAADKVVIVNLDDGTVECLPSHAERDVGLVLGTEMTEYNYLVSKYLLPHMSSTERRQYSLAMKAVYEQIVNNPETPVGKLDAETTAMLRDLTAKRIPELEAEQKTTHDKAKRLFEELQEAILARQTKAYEKELAKLERAERKERAACAADESGITTVSCSDKVLESKYATARRLLEIKYCHGDIEACSSEKVQRVLALVNPASDDLEDKTSYYLTQIEAFLKSTRPPRNTPYFEGINVYDSGVVHLGDDYAKRLYELSDELTSLKESTEEELYWARLFHQELDSAEEGLPIIVPTFSYNEKTGLFWEGKSKLPKDAQELTLINAETLIHESGEVIRTTPRVIQSVRQSRRIDFGGRATLSINNTVPTLDERQLERIYSQLDGAIAKMDIPGDHKDTYLSRIKPSIKEVRIISAEEMRYRWIQGLRTKLAEAQSTSLYQNPDRVRELALELAVSTESDFIPNGLYSNGVIYLIPSSNIGDTFVHEVAHAAQKAFVSSGALSSQQLESVYQELRDRMPTDNNKISRHSLVKAQVPSGGSEWFTDGLKAYWTNRAALKKVDPHLYLFFSLLHHNADSEIVVDEPAHEDPETGDWVEAETHQEWELTPSNPFTSSQRSKNARFALGHYTRGDWGWLYQLFEI